MARERGLKCGKMSFWRAIRNSCYIGKILVPKFNNEEETLAEGLHEPLISESLFYEVQDILDGRKRNPYVQFKKTHETPLRGFMVCLQYDRTLTGSRSKGRTRYYIYYHCKSPCRVRFKSESVDKYFMKYLAAFTPNSAMAQLYKGVVCDTYNDTTEIFQNDKRRLVKEITERNSRLAKSRELLLVDAIDAKEYKNIKVESEKKITLLEAKLSEIGEQISYELDVKSLVEKALENLKNISLLYREGDIEAKQFIIGSIFPEKFVFNGEIDRTIKMNLAFKLIYHLNSKSPNKKKRVRTKIRTDSHWVFPKGFEPPSLVPETKILSIELRKHSVKYIKID